jgi:PAS domain S-box-containing protein
MPADTILEKVDILMVDDREENLIALESTLSSATYNLIKARSGDEALRYLLDHRPALILMDVQMPGLDGFETASIIRSSPRTRDIPIIFITAINFDEHYVHSGYEHGAVDYLYKPYDAFILKSKVAVFVELFRKTKSLLKAEQELRDSEIKNRERQIAQLELRNLKREKASQKKYRDLVEGIEDGIVWTADPDSLAISFASPSVHPILGYTPDRIVSNARPLTVHVHPDDQDRFASAIDEVKRKTGEKSLEHRFVRSDGRVLWAQTRIKMAIDVEGAREEIRGLSIDTTKSKEVESRLVEAVRVREEFLSLASHELKTPLTSLRLQLQMAQRNIKTANASSNTAVPIERLKKSIDMSLDQSLRLATLIDDLLDVSRIKAGMLSYQFDNIDITELVRKTLSQLAGQLELAHCQLTTHIDGPIFVSGDRARLEQVIVNLVINAMKYGAGQPIDVFVTRFNGNVKITIRDQGIGIAKEKQTAIFKRFERAVGPTNISGLGLGLYITHQIVMGHEGKITVESELGKGSVFTVILPLSRELSPSNHPLTQGNSKLDHPSDERVS